MNISRDFNTLADWLEYSERDLPNDPSPYVRSSITFSPNFAQVATKAEAFHILRTGYPKGRELMEKIKDSLEEQIILDTIHDHFISDVTGSAPNVEAYLQGQPEDMFVISQIESTAPPSQLTVQFELCYAACIPIQCVATAGAVVFSALEALKMQGCTVDILVTHTVSQSSHTWQSSFRIPPFIDIDTLSFIFTHPASLRILTFSVMEHEPADIRNHFGFYAHGGGYGSCTHIKHPQADAFLDMASIANQIHHSGSTNQLQKAKEIFQHLVATRFDTLQLL